MARTRAQRLKKASAGTWGEVELSQGLLVNILSRLPVQTIRSFRSVNKYWYDSVSNNFFAKQQLIRSRENPSYIACPNMDEMLKLYSMKPGSFKVYDLNTINPSERSDEQVMYMISSFNGLICCINHIRDEDVEENFCDMQIWIINPCMGETLLLPQGRPSFVFEPSVGVAYGSDTSDYTVFRIFCAGKKLPEGRVFGEGSYLYECEVYSSSTGAWKNIGPVPCAPMRSHLSPFKSAHVFVGGRIYWLSSLDDEGAIVSVDLEGTFMVIRLPRYPSNLKGEDQITEASYLINLRGSLRMVILHPGYMDIWVRKGGCNPSVRWARVRVHSIPFDDDDVVLAMTSSKNQIICVTETHWCSYDVDTRIWRTKEYKAGFGSPAVFPFTESVLSCKGGVRL